MRPRRVELDAAQGSALTLALTQAASAIGAIVAIVDAWRRSRPSPDRDGTASRIGTPCRSISFDIQSGSARTQPVEELDIR